MHKFILTFSFCLAFLLSLAQKITVKGTVKDETGTAVPNATISIKGTATTTMADTAGIFSVSARANAVLIISSIGYKTKEVAMGGSDSTTLNVVLTSTNQGLNDVVVVGYGTEKKINLSGAVASVSGAVLESRPITNINAGLEGVLPNLNITPSSGRPDDAASFNIRGFASISSSGTPLILVDNVPFSAGQLASLNPSDIANVTVLKDAGAAAVYGGRAAFGVVLITTKSARLNQLQVHASGNVAYRTIGSGPDIITDPLQIMEAKNAAYTPWGTVYSQTALNYAKQLEKDPSLPRTIVDPDNPTQYLYYGSTNWPDEIFGKNAPTYTANISVAKKDDKLAYFLSAGYYNQQGLLKENGDIFHRYNLRSSATYQITKWWKIGNNTAYNYTSYNYPLNNDVYMFWDVMRTPSTDEVYNPDGSYTSSGSSIVGQLKNGGRVNYNIGDFLTTFNTEIDIIKKDLTLKADGTFHNTNQPQRTYAIPVPYVTGPGQPVQYQLADGISASYAQNDYTSTTDNVYNVYADYQKTLGKHSIHALAGFNQEHYQTNYSSVNVQDLITSSVPSIQTATGIATGNESINDYALRGLFYRLNYIYADKYILEFDGRDDGSSRFPANHRWGFFPSGSAAWVISKEKFFHDIISPKNWSLFKLRGSYGVLGNQLSNSYYPYIATLGSGKISQILDGTQPIAVTLPAVVSSNLTWEKVKTINIGTDLGFLNNKLTISYDWYTRYTEGMLVPSKTLPAVFGASSPVTNAADLKTIGWDLSVNWHDDYKVAGYPWTVSATVALANSNAYITKYDNPTGLLSNYYKGERIGTIWGMVNDGFFQNANQIAALDESQILSYSNEPMEIGDLRFKDINGDKKITQGNNTLSDPGDRKVIGNSSPRFPYSLDLSTSWKGFDLRIFLQGIGKMDWYPNSSNIYFWGLYAQPWTNLTKFNEDRWTPDNPNSGYFPRLKAYSADGSGELSLPQTRYLQNAGYLRAKNITFGYSLPSLLMKKWGLKSLRFYFSAENLLTFTSLKGGLDPEGLAGNIYPFQKTFSFGFDMNL